MYFDGTYTDQITDNLAQDVTPTISDGYILWTVLGESEQEARVYSLDSGEALTINGYEGGMITNPRFVLVYDTMFENGDIVTQGFDPATGLSAPISAQPASLPVDIPETDATGEIRALVQGKSSQKDKQLTDDIRNDTGSTTPNATVAATSTLTDSTLDLTQLVDEQGTSTPNGSVTQSVSDSATVFQLTDYDLVLTSLPSTTTTPSSTNTKPGV
jgi:hypothetical protein